ncbi:Type IV pilus biogenesis protein PilM [Candidatus Sumerlaea chitinivorans]|uniref:Type IV pilus biogenesis protein PilM n=1 Tax=Sumerlaea chitinivorans TaxID=2250252 RepID=A0A2Z4Y4M5_SUMC1|nr:Type IV pilus biogenesis protein PilM [Candidatus Sumerlaea chitinivorans]
MHNIRKCLGVDIGTTSVKIAEIVAEKTGARVTRLLSTELPVGRGQTDAERNAAVARVIRDLLKENKVATKHAVFCLSGQHVFIRRIRIPRTTEERMHRIIAYEARQQIPFALENAVVEYQVFDFDDPAEVEVLLVAVKKDLVAEMMKLIGKLGLKPVMISVSSLALFNAHVFEATPFEDLLVELGLAKKAKPASKTSAEESQPANEEGGGAKKGFSFKFPKLSFGKKAAGKPSAEEAPPEYADEEEEETVFEEVRAFVNVGAQTFDLAIARLGKRRILGFTRSVPWGGLELTRTIQEKLGIESSEEAEQVKRSRALIVVPGREEEVEAQGADPDASEFATSWADRLILDLRKSFDYYISQPDGVAVDSIWLSGGQAVQPNLATYIEEKLGIPVEIKSQVENEALRLPSIEDPHGYTNYWIALGLGLTGLGYGRINVDFLPRELKTLREFKKKNIEVFLMIGAIVGMLLVSSQIGQREIANMQQWLEQNRPKIETAASTKKRLDDARQEREKVNAKITAIGEGISDRAFWLEFLGVVQAAKPADVLITSISMKPDGEVTIVCEAESARSLLDFDEALKKQKEWIKDSAIESSQTVFSNAVGKQVTRVRIKLQVHWKTTRLAPSRATLAPGLLYPTPAPTATQGPGGPRPGAGPGAPPEMLGL